MAVWFLLEISNIPVSEQIHSLNLERRKIIQKTSTKEMKTKLVFTFCRYQEIMYALEKSNKQY